MFLFLVLALSVCFAQDMTPEEIEAEDLTYQKDAVNLQLAEAMEKVCLLNNAVCPVTDEDRNGSQSQVNMWMADVNSGAATLWMPDESTVVFTSTTPESSQGPAEEDPPDGPAGPADPPADPPTVQAWHCGCPGGCEPTTCPLSPAGKVKVCNQPCSGNYCSKCVWSEIQAPAPGGPDDPKEPTDPTGGDSDGP